MVTGEQAELILDYVITVHAALEMKRRDLSEDTIRSVLAAPGQRLEARPGRVILQSRISLGAPAREFLARVFVDVDRRPAEVVTAYRSTKIGKYWRQP
jgi:hypothetical protein